MKTNDPKPELKQLEGVTIISDHPLTRQCPNCTRHFKPEHLSRKYCSINCHDMFHNRIKRNKRIAAEVIAEEANEILFTEEDKITNDDQLRRNEEIIHSINPGTAGKLVYIDDLIKQGYDLFTYLGKYPMDDAGKRHFVTVGQFAIARLYSDKFFIQQKSPIS
jgi:hypothetical protein